MSTVRTNAAVLEVIKASGQQPVVDLTKPVTLQQVEKLHSILKRRDGRYESNGGIEGLRWSHRILKQYGSHVTSEGEFQSDEFLDYHLGPYIVMGLTKTTPQEIGKRITVPAIIQPGSGDTTVVFVAGTGDEAQCGDVVLATDGVWDLEDAFVIGKSEYKLKMMRKSSSGKASAFTSVQIEPFELDGIEFEECFLLSSQFKKKDSVVFKVDASLGLVFGWGLVSKIDGKDYYDTQGDHLTEDGIVKAAMDYMLKHRTMGDMHAVDTEDENTEDGLPEVHKGTMVFCMPITEEIMKAFNIQCNMTGLMIAVKPDDPEILEKFRDGRYTGFSFGGRRIPEYTEEVG